MNLRRHDPKRLPLGPLDGQWALDETEPLWPCVAMMAAAAMAVVVLVVALRVLDSRRKARADAGEIPCYQGHGAACPGGRP